MSTEVSFRVKIEGSDSVRVVTANTEELGNTIDGVADEAKQKTATVYFPTSLVSPVMQMPGSRPLSATQASTRKSHSTSAATLSPPSH